MNVRQIAAASLAAGAFLALTMPQTAAAADARPTPPRTMPRCLTVPTQAKAHTPVWQCPGKRFGGTVPATSSERLAKGAHTAPTGRVPLAG